MAEDSAGKKDTSSPTTRFERLPFEECRIKNAEKGRVKLLGTIVAKDDAHIVLDDGASIDCFFTDEEVLPKLENYRQGDEVTIIGLVREGSVAGEIIHKEKEVNRELYNKVLEILNED